MEQNHATRVRLANTIFATQSLFSAGQIAIITLLAIVAVDISGRESLAGVPSTTLTLTQALTALPLGLFMGRFGRRFGLTAAYSLSAIGALVGVIAIMLGSFGLLLLSSALLGMGRAGGEQSRYAAGDMFPDGDRAKMIGRVVFAGTIGAIFGPMLVVPSSQLSMVFGLLGDTGPWLIGIGLYTIAALITLFLLKPDPLTFANEDDDVTETHEVITITGRRSIRQLLRDPLVQLAVLSMLISQLVMVALMVITPVHMSHHEHGRGAVSIVIMAHTLGMFGLSSVTGYLIARFGVYLIMIVGAVILIVSAIIAPISATMPFLVVGLFLLGLGWNFCYIAGSTLLSQGLHGIERNRMQGTSDMFVAGAAALGSLSTGPIFGIGDYIAVAGVSIVIVMLFLFIMRVLKLQIVVEPKPGRVPLQ